jgi:hypothetical protein
MSRHLGFVVPAAFALLFTCACVGVEEDADGRVGDAPLAFLYENALNANALNANALNANALNANALNANALNANGLDPSLLGDAVGAALADPGAAGELSRQLFKYTVSCALSRWQSLSISWTDVAGVAHQETYPGLLGLAPTWQWYPPTETQQEWVSACLASRVNWYGVPVTISSRGRARVLETSAQELAGYPELEGAFWGNLFSATPHLSACHDPADDGSSRARLRDCAAGHLDAGGNVLPCGMIQLVGACDDVCDAPASGTTYYPGCSDAPGDADSRTTHVVTTYLP